MNMMTEAALEKAVDQKMNAVPLKMGGKDVSVYYGEKRALFDVNLDIRENTVTALIVITLGGFGSMGGIQRSAGFSCTGVWH